MNDYLERGGVPNDLDQISLNALDLLYMYIGCI